MYSFLIHAKDANWSEDVKPNPSNKELPEGLFDKSPSGIAYGLKSNSKDFAQAMQRLQFYINRAGKNLDTAELTKYESAKDLLYRAYGKEKPKDN